MLTDFLPQLILCICISLGMIIGGSFLGSLGALICGGHPATTMLDLAQRLKIWAAVASLGGTFSTIRVIESMLWERQLAVLIQQISLVVAAFGAAHIGYLLVLWTVTP
ncbi:MAG: YtrH family sporulation protein [Bacillota bacterium]|jgi:hypothetical protein